MENQVPEIWFIDPEEESINVFDLNSDGTYDEQKSTLEPLSSPVFPGLEFSPTDLFI
jgi:Uma2 family endonuclease